MRRDDEIEFSNNDVVIIFRDDDSTDVILPEFHSEFFSEPDPIWKGMMTAALFYEGDDEINALRNRLEIIIDELGLVGPGSPPAAAVTR